MNYGDPTWSSRRRDGRHDKIDGCRTLTVRLITSREQTMTETSAVIKATHLSCSLTCKDLAASIRFFREAVGFSVAATYETEGKVTTAVIVAGNCQIVLNQDDGKTGLGSHQGPGLLSADQRAERGRSGCHRGAHQGRRRHADRRAGRPAVGRPDVPVQGSRRLQVRRLDAARRITCTGRLLRQHGRPVDQHVHG